MKYRDDFREAMEKEGHKPVLSEDGSFDYFVYDEGYHNGPGCSKCGWSMCWHCDGVESIPQCPTPTA